MPNKVQGIKDDSLSAHNKQMAHLSKKGIDGLDRHFQYNPEFPGNPKSPDSIPSTKRSKKKNRTTKLARRNARRNR